MKKLIIHELAVSVREREDVLPGRIAKKLGIRVQDIRAWGIVRKSLDARKKDNLQYKYSLWIQTEEAVAGKLMQKGIVVYEAAELPVPQEGQKGQYRHRSGGKCLPEDD